METQWIKKSVCLVCLGLLMALTAGTGQTSVGKSQSGTPSVLDRVQSETDTELSELIRIAVTNRKNVTEQERLELVRKVTQSHAQIKLLDQQIEQVASKIDSNTGPAELRSELVLAKAELESKRTTELANLRELMGVIPRFPFGPQPILNCNTSLRLNVIDQRMHVLDTLKPFDGYWAMERFKSLGLLSESEVLDLLRQRLKGKESLPARIDILHTVATANTSEKLRDAIVALLAELNVQMEAEVRLILIDWAGSGESTFFLREEKIRTLHPAAVRRPDGSRELLQTGLVDLGDLEQHILWRLLHPGNLPFRFRIEYDEASATLAKQVADTAKGAAKRLGVDEIVDVMGALVEPIPETAFLGRWQAVTQGEMQTIDIQSGGVCQVTMGKGSQAIPAGASVKGTWMPTTKETIIDIKDAGAKYFLYRGTMDADGNLVIDRGVVYRQGSFFLSGPSETIFKKVQ